MSSQVSNGTMPEPPRTPKRDAQWWLGWLAAVLVVIIIVAVAAMAWEQLSRTEPDSVEVQMTPLVGGMILVTTTPTSETPETTPVPAAVEAVAAGDTMTVTALSPVTSTLTETAVIVEEATVTATMTATAAVETATPQPTATPAPTATPTAAPTATKTPPTPTPIPAAVVQAVYAPGDQVASRAGRLTLYANVTTDAPVLDSYGVGVALTVIEPSGDYTGYPVVAGGHGWVRVRAADGLVGWVTTDTLEAQP